MSIQGLGTDIIEIERIRTAVSRHGSRFEDHLFTKNEQIYCGRFSDPIPHFAGRFAAKEAVLKALGTGLTAEIQWLDIEVVLDPRGKPQIALSPRLQILFPDLVFFLSISHCQQYAVATAIATRNS